MATMQIKNKDGSTYKNIDLTQSRAVSQPTLNGKPIQRASGGVPTQANLDAQNKGQRQALAFERVLPQSLRYREQKHENLPNFSATANDALRRVTQARNNSRRADARNAFYNNYNQQMDRGARVNMHGDEMAYKNTALRDENAYRAVKSDIDSRYNDIRDEGNTIKREQMQQDLFNSRADYWDNELSKSGNYPDLTPEEQQIAREYYMETGKPIPLKVVDEGWFSDDYGIDRGAYNNYQSQRNEQSEFEEFLRQHPNAM